MYSILQEMVAMTIYRAKLASSQPAHVTIYASKYVYIARKYTQKKTPLAVNASFLFQITMNDNIIMSKQLFMIPEREACRLHNVQLFID